MLVSDNRRGLMKFMSNIRILCMDIDGTLTDGKIYMGAKGEIMKAFSVHDGYAIKHILRDCGIVPVVITARENDIVNNRCKELGISEIYQGCSNKIEKLKEIADKFSLLYDGDMIPGVAYIGDDMLDLDCIKSSEVSGCPANSCKEIKRNVDYVCEAKGGEGAVREFIEWILQMQEK